MLVSQLQKNMSKKIKILKKSQIAGYKVDMWLNTEKGERIKYFSSTSGVDELQAEQNCLKRMRRFCRQAIRWFDDQSKNFYVDEYVIKLFKAYKLTKSDFEFILKKISPLIKDIDTNEPVEL